MTFARNALSSLARPALAIVATLSAFGCGSEGPAAPSSAVSLPAASNGGTTTGGRKLVAQYDAHADMTTKRISFSPAKHQPGSAAQGFALAVDNTLTFSQAVDGDFGAASGIGSCSSATWFCANITVTNNNAFTLANLSAEVDGLVGGATAVKFNNAVKTGYAPPLDTTWGVFNYGVLTSSQALTKPWGFVDAATTDFNFQVSVYGTTLHATHGPGSSASGSVKDACVSGATVIASGSAGGTVVALNLPFEVSAYQVIGDTNAWISDQGVLGFGQTTPSGSSLTSPSTLDAGSPFASNTGAGIAPFWENLKGGSVCAQVSGSSPNREYWVTWKNMDVVSTAFTESLSFTAVVHEGTDVVDFVYNSMNSDPVASQPTVSQGLNATIGIQGIDVFASSISTTYSASAANGGPVNPLPYATSSYPTTSVSFPAN